ncbi:MAG: GntR family transcriptional regulator [Bacillota bacterium]|nr:MAG: GntR family transcriptional regulator [Bacillota bacterium]
MISYRDFVAKHAKVAMRIAQDLVRARPGDRLPPVGDYARDLGVGRGTVQTAVRLLKDSGAVSLVPRGHMGTFIASVDQAALWHLTGLGTITGVMPLPYSQRYRGLATGLYKAFHQADVPLVLAHMRGARRRLEALTSRRYEFALVSRHSYETASREVDYLEIAVALGPQTSVREHVLLLRDGRAGGIQDGMRVGVDPASIDITELTRRECAGARVTLVEVPYTQFPGQIQKGVIDAAVWDAEEALPKGGAGMRVVQLRDGGFGTRPDTGEAVLVVQRDNQVLRGILAEKIDPAVVSATQARVLAGQELPEL